MTSTMTDYTTTTTATTSAAAKSRWTKLKSRVSQRLRLQKLPLSSLSNRRSKHDNDDSEGKENASFVTMEIEFERDDLHRKTDGGDDDATDTTSLSTVEEDEDAVEQVDNDEDDDTTRIDKRWVHRPEKRKFATVKYDYTDTLALPQHDEELGAPKQPKMLRFQETTEVMEIPSWRDYPQDELDRMYTCTSDIKANGERCKREFAWDGWDWRNATEDSGSCDWVHPATQEYLTGVEESRQCLLSMWDMLYGTGEDNDNDLWSDDEEGEEESEEEETFIIFDDSSSHKGQQAKTENALFNQAIRRSPTMSDFSGVFGFDI